MTREKYTPQYSLLSRGVYPDGSVWAQSPTTTLGDATVRSHTSICDRRLAPYLGELLEGGTVVDIWACDWSTAAHLVINGPMLDMDLPDGTCKRFADEVPRIMLDGLQGAFGAIARRKDADPSWSGLDYVCLSEWLRLRRQIGARIGTRRGKVVQWEDGTTTTIPPEAERWADNPMDRKPATESPRPVVRADVLVGQQMGLLE